MPASRMQSLPNALIDQEKQRNRESRNLFHTMAAHRRRVTREILRLCNSDSSVCILGAGNCNDLDLIALTSNSTRLVLVDLDQEALEHAQERYVAQAPALDVRGNIDLTGVFSTMTSKATTPARMIAAATEFTGPDLGRDPFHVVVSTCMLSQIILAARSSLPEGSAEFPSLALALRNRHLELMLENTAPGGHALVITDIVSSSTAPELLAAKGYELVRLRDELLGRHNHFFGLNPHKIEQYVRRHLANRCCGIQHRPPWVWSFGDRCYLVAGLVLQRSP